MFFNYDKEKEAKVNKPWHIWFCRVFFVLGLACAVVALFGALVLDIFTYWYFLFGTALFLSSTALSYFEGNRTKIYTLKKFDWVFFIISSVAVPIFIILLVVAFVISGMFRSSETKEKFGIKPDGSLAAIEKFDENTGKGIGYDGREYDIKD